MQLIWVTSDPLATVGLSASCLPFRTHVVSYVSVYDTLLTVYFLNKTNRSSEKMDSERKSEEKELLYTVILPTYNERENLPLVFYLIHKTFVSVGKAFEVVIVDDSSPDNTLEVAKSLQEVFPMIQIVSRKGKLGLGSAYLAGLRVAKGNRIVLMDADLSHHPKFIVPMMELMDGNHNCTVDIVCGTRYKKGGGVAGWYVILCSLSF